MAGTKEKAGEIGPGSTVRRLQLRHGPEGADRIDGLLELEGDQADQEVALGQIWLGTQNATTALGRLIDAPGVEMREALADGVLYPGCGPTGHGALHEKSQA
jgi:hypothetical protein